jgi:hypothetical protein
MNRGGLAALCGKGEAMQKLSEEDVRTAAKCMGYELVKFPGGYELSRPHAHEKEIIVATSLELIVDFLKH